MRPGEQRYVHPPDERHFSPMQSGYNGRLCSPYSIQPLRQSFTARANDLTHLKPLTELALGPDVLFLDSPTTQDEEGFKTWYACIKAHDAGLAVLLPTFRRTAAGILLDNDPEVHYRLEFTPKEVERRLLGLTAAFRPADYQPLRPEIMRIHQVETFKGVSRSLPPC